MMLANMLIFVHAVVPHHHHSKVFMAIVDVLDDDAHNVFDHDHVFLSHYDVGDLFFGTQSVTAYDEVLLLADVVELCGVPSIESISKILIHWPYIARGYTNCFISSDGLRAPPIF